jgi:hypothetical protein
LLQVAGKQAIEDGHRWLRLRDRIPASLLRRDPVSGFATNVPGSGQTSRSGGPASLL